MAQPMLSLNQVSHASAQHTAGSGLHKGSHHEQETTSSTPSGLLQSIHAPKEIRTEQAEQAPRTIPYRLHMKMLDAATFYEGFDDERLEAVFEDYASGYYRDDMSARDWRDYYVSVIRPEYTCRMAERDAERSVEVSPVCTTTQHEQTTNLLSSSQANVHVEELLMDFPDDIDDPPQKNHSLAPDIDIVIPRAEDDITTFFNDGAWRTSLDTAQATTSTDCDHDKTAVKLRFKDVESMREVIYTPKGDEKEAYHTVIITKVPVGTTLVEIIDQVKFGPIYSVDYIKTHSMSTKPNITTDTILLRFVHAQHAHDFALSARTTPLTVKFLEDFTTDLQVDLITTCTRPIPRHILSKITSDDTSYILQVQIPYNDWTRSSMASSLNDILLKTSALDSEHIELQFACLKDIYKAHAALTNRYHLHSIVYRKPEIGSSCDSDEEYYTANED